MKEKIVIIFAITISVVIILITLRPMVMGGSMSNEKAGMFRDIITSIIAIIAFYIGQKSKE